MRASAIRYLSTARLSRLLAAGLWEKTIQIWDLDQRKQIGQFDTGMEDGCNRLEMAPRGDRGVVAAWRSGRKGGVASYEIPTGEILWRRTDLRQSQGLSYSPDGQNVWFEPDEGRVQRLDAVTGERVETLRGVKHLHFSDYSTDVLIERRNGDYILRGEKDFAVPKKTFAVLDVAFGPKSVCLTESGGPVRCFHCHQGAEVWHYEPPSNSHVLRLWYRESDGNFYGVQWQYHTGGPRKLLRFDGLSGVAAEICQFHSWKEAASVGLDCIILSGGEMLSLSTGNLLGTLNFPQRDYPESR